MRSTPPHFLFIKAAATVVLLITGTFSAPDSLSDTTAVYSEGCRSDETLAAPDTATVTATEAAQKMVGKTTKILAAAGTSAVVIGVTTYFLVNFFKENNDREDSGIPDPPDPPGYW